MAIYTEPILFFFLHCPGTEEAGGELGAGGDTDGTVDTTDQRDIIDHVMSCSEIKAREIQS